MAVARKPLGGQKPALRYLRASAEHALFPLAQIHEAQGAMAWQLIVGGFDLFRNKSKVVLQKHSLSGSKVATMSSGGVLFRHVSRKCKPLKCEELTYQALLCRQSPRYLSARLLSAPNSYFVQTLHESGAIESPVKSALAREEQCPHVGEPAEMRIPARTAVERESEARHVPPLS